MRAKHMLKDPSKGIVLQKLEGTVVRVLEDEEELTPYEIQYYSRGNHIMEKSFTAGSSRKGLRIVAEFPKSTVGRYRILHSYKWLHCDSNSIEGYVDMTPNSIKFIKEA
jgi:hypothetical protein